ncbi:MAG TPA: TRAP transporter small permease [Burkholderiales bacterium]
MRRFLDRLYAASGAAAAVCLAAIAAVMLLQAGTRAAGLLFRGADDIVAWLCAASAFLALGYSFRHGDLVRVSLLINLLPERQRRGAEIACLSAALVVVGYITWATASFVFESWRLDELAQGLIRIPIWIPQTSLVAGAAILTVAVLDELIVVLRGGKPAYRLAEEERLARKDFSENV